MEIVSFWDNVRVDAPGAPWFFTASPEKIHSYGKGFLTLMNSPALFAHCLLSMITGVVYYMRGGRVMGVLLYNNFGKIDLARSVLGRKIPADELASKISCS